MPDFVGNPAGAFGGKSQDGGGDGQAGEDAVGAGEFSVEGGFGDGFGWLAERRGCADAFDGKAAQAFFVVAPGVQIPVVAVVGEALRGDFAAAGFVALAVVVIDLEAVALQDGAGEGLKVAEVFLARGGGKDADALGGFARAQVIAVQQFVDAGLQWPQVVVEQAGFEVGEQVFQRDEGLQFGGGEPQAGECVAAVGGVVAIAAAFAVMDERGAEAVAQVGDQAGEGGTGETMLANEYGA